MTTDIVDAKERTFAFACGAYGPAWGRAARGAVMSFWIFADALWDVLDAREESTDDTALGVEITALVDKYAPVFWDLNSKAGAEFEKHPETPFRAGSGKWAETLAEHMWLADYVFIHIKRAFLNPADHGGFEASARLVWGEVQPLYAVHRSRLDIWWHASTRISWV